VGVGESRRAAGAFVPSSHLLDVLGPRPISPSGQHVWKETAEAVEQYRSRWGITDRSNGLGISGSGRDLSGLSAGRLADHLTMTRRITETRRMLGRDLYRSSEREGLALER